MSRLNNRTITKMSFTHFMCTIWCLSFYIVHGHENVIHFSELNCSTNSMRQTSTIASDTIVINNCSLKTLPNGIFVSYARSLSIYDTELDVIESLALDGLKRLETLSLYRNQLTEISPWTEHDLVNLHKIDMHHNKIQTISLKAFQHYPNVETINLSINNLTDIPANIFKYTPRLRILNLAKNHLRRIEGFTFNELAELTHISLEHNDIDFVENFAFVNNVRLRSIRLDFNKIVSFDNLLLSNCQQLVYLNLSHNALTAIHEHTFKNNVQLNTLDISGNMIPEFSDHSFNGLSQLEIFNASNNSLDTLKPYTFLTLVKLKLFDASSNKLTYLFDGMLDYLSTVKHINLSHNAIDRIETNVFTQMTSIETIDLSYNKLSNDSFLDGITKLKTLIMAYNQFGYLNLSKLVDVDEVDVIGNPWNCTWLVVEMMRRSEGIHFGDDFSIAMEEQVLTVPGIDCVDDSGKNRSVVMVEQSSTRKAEKILNEMPTYDEQNQLLKRMLQNEFSYKACLIWTVIAVIVVFGGVHLGKILLKKSERRSERYRMSQQILISTTPTTANTEVFADSKLIYR